VQIARKEIQAWYLYQHICNPVNCQPQICSLAILYKKDMEGGSFFMLFQTNAFVSGQIWLYVSSDPLLTTPQIHTIASLALWISWRIPDAL
jgi:hypothetical protein